MNRGNLKECYEAFVEYESETKEDVFSFFRSVRVYIGGLASFQIYRDTGDIAWKSRGEECIKEFKVWAEQGSDWNFEHKLQLMKAEDYYCSGNYEKAIESYKKAIASARAHRYFNDEALACDLAGHFFLNTDDLALSLEYLRLAQVKYCKWEAHGKANQLQDFITATFARE